MNTPAVKTACILPIVAIATIGVAAVPVAIAEHFTGTNGFDHVTGTPRYDRIEGLAPGNDRITGGAGDLISAGRSSDGPNVSQAAGSSPPRSALIVEGRSIAGADLASKAPKSELGDRILGGVLAGWGPVDGPGSCFEGSNC